MSRKKTTIEDETPSEEETEVVFTEEEFVLEAPQDCDCDTSTRQSGFCPHGNSV